jgi:hypothetical protein
VVSLPYPSCSYVSATLPPSRCPLPSATTAMATAASSPVSALFVGARPWTSPDPGGKVAPP